MATAEDVDSSDEEVEEGDIGHHIKQGGIYLVFSGVLCCVCTCRVAGDATWTTSAAERENWHQKVSLSTANT